MGAFVLTFILFFVVVACCLYANNRKKEKETIDDVPNVPTIPDEPSGTNGTVTPSVGGGAHREATSETMEAKNNIKKVNRDPKTGRFIKKAGN